MAGQLLLTRSQRHIAGSIIYCGTEFIEVLPPSTLRDPKKPISHQVGQIYGAAGEGVRQLLAGGSSSRAARLLSPGTRGAWNRDQQTAVTGKPL